MRFFRSALFAAATIALGTGVSHGQSVTLWSNAGTTVHGTCLGNTFLICTNWRAWLDVDPNHVNPDVMHFWIENVSNMAPANNLNSAITFIGIAGGVPDPEYVNFLGSTGKGNWTLSKQDVNGFSGWGIVNKSGFGFDDGPGDPQVNGLTDGTWVEFKFSFKNNVSFANAVIAVHDQDGPLDKCSGKAVWKAVDGTNGAVGGDKLYQDPNDPALVPCMGNVTITPEPATVALIAPALLGVFGVAARRVARLG
jgi:hypothetical protein